MWLDPLTAPSFSNFRVFGKVAMVKFIHAADLHLDSRLDGLQRYEGAPVDRIRSACRRALENLVELAIGEGVDFLLLAGDIYDGDWSDYNTGLYFIKQMVRLNDAGIRIFMISGNHDAANRMTRALRLPPNVTMLSTEKPESRRLEDLGVVIHGQGFATGAVTEDLSKNYPPALGGYFNIGLLHTCIEGAEGHDRYAPCTLSGLKNKGYDYWALGHIHKRWVVSTDPYVVYSGNIQGRHIRETGPKGCYLGTLMDNRLTGLEFRRLDVVRWEVCEVTRSGDRPGRGLVRCGREPARIAPRQRGRGPVARGPNGAYGPMQASRTTDRRPRPLHRPDSEPGIGSRHRIGSGSKRSRSRHAPGRPSRSKDHWRSCWPA